MVLYQYPPTRKQLLFTAVGTLTGAALFAVGAHLSFSNIGPQQSKTQARREFIKARLRKYLDD